MPPSPKKVPMAPFPPAVSLSLTNEFPSYTIKLPSKLLPLHWVLGQLTSYMILKEISQIPTVLKVSWIGNPLVSKARDLGFYSLHCRSPGLGYLMSGTNPSYLKKRLRNLESPLLPMLEVGFLVRSCLCLPCHLDVALLHPLLRREPFS